MTVTIIGGGGREHAIAWKLKNDDKNIRLYAVPGNGGISGIAECVSIDTSDVVKLAEFAEEKGSDYTIVGPEVPLSMGIADIFAERGLKVFGPSMKGAMLESSKVFAKQFMKRNGIPTADFIVVSSHDEGVKALEEAEYPCVLKYDGLAAGKGVVVAENREEAVMFLDGVYGRKVFGRGSRKVIIEKCLRGRELSYLVFTDTLSFLPMVPAKDHKRVFDCDRGPNTGGMGCSSPPAFFTEDLGKEIRKKIVIPTLNGLSKENVDYRGVLYFGLMLTQDGPFLLEYNARFGDPETQVILPRMKSPHIETVKAVTERRLDSISIESSDRKSECVKLASSGYPGSYSKGKVVKGLSCPGNVTIFHAGTEKRNGDIFTSGGRVLGITAMGTTMREAREDAYRAAALIDFEGKHYRTDIGLDSSV
jgi:phosphoribosylamine--glycine ligase